MNAAANILMKVGSRTAQAIPPNAPVWSKTLNFLNLATSLGLVLFACNVLFYRKALDGLNLSVAYPVMVSGALILVTIAAVFVPLLSERINAWQIGGMGLIACGVWLVARG